ncbi:hypothetical protein [Pontibacter fetidus]|uniref:Uncharacterized protein n=1 Tax=Pontibacter fetidus TaxID=2700082 RepID=A0A6B2H8Z2_9BACT|nr:hypothetical protein [Pontibacter fetidus]NDK55684.1 hypothetical protein [Pontibacter fetidus]
MQNKVTCSFGLAGKTQAYFALNYKIPELCWKVTVQYQHKSDRTKFFNLK